MVNTFIDYWFLFIVSLLFFYLIGSFIIGSLKINTSNSYFNLFFRFLVGAVAAVCGISIFATRGKTIMLGLLLVGLFALLEFRRMQLPNSQPEKSGRFFLKISRNQFLELLIVASGLYVLRFFMSFKYPGIPLEVHGDNVFYAKISRFLLKSGIESSYFDFFEPLNVNAPAPYHYFELWLNNINSLIFNTVSLTNLLLVTFTVLSVLVYLGLCALVNHYNLHTAFYKLISFLFIFFSGFLVWGLKSIPFFAYIDVFTVTPFSYPKTLVIYLFIILAVIAFLNKKDKHGVLSLLCLPILFISTAPAVLAGIMVYAVACYLFGADSQHRKSGLAMMGYTLAIAVFIGAFYFISSRSGGAESVHSGAALSLTEQLKQGSFWKTFINIIGGTLIQIGVLHFLVSAAIIVFIYAFRNKVVFKYKVNYPLLFPILFLGGLVCWGIMHNMSDSVQLFTNLGIPLLHIVIFVAIIRMLTFYRTAFLKAGILVFFLFCAVTKIHATQSKEIYSPQYLIRIGYAIKGLNPQGAYIRGKEEYVDMFAKNVDFAILGKYLSFMNSDFHPVNISVFDIPLNENDRNYSTERKFVENSDFYRFVQVQKSKGNFKSVEQSQLDFLKVNKIDYLIVSGNARLSEGLSNSIKYEIKDPATEERFLLLK